MNTGRSTGETPSWYSKLNIFEALWITTIIDTVRSSAAENSVPPLQRAVNKFIKALIQRFLGLFVYFITEEQRKVRQWAV